jgi:hypothetical protein
MRREAAVVEVKVIERHHSLGKKQRQQKGENPLVKLKGTQHKKEAEA